MNSTIALRQANSAGSMLSALNLLARPCRLARLEARLGSRSGWSAWQKRVGEERGWHHWMPHSKNSSAQLSSRRVTFKVDNCP